MSYGNTNSWLIIRARDRWKFRVSILVPGLSRFLEKCEQYLPLSALKGAKDGYTRVGRPFPEMSLEAEVDPAPWEKWMPRKQP